MKHSFRWVQTCLMVYMVNFNLMCKFKSCPDGGASCIKPTSPPWAVSFFSSSCLSGVNTGGSGSLRQIRLTQTSSHGTVVDFGVAAKDGDRDKEVVANLPTSPPPSSTLPGAIFTFCWRWLRREKKPTSLPPQIDASSTARCSSVLISEFPAQWL